MGAMTKRQIKTMAKCFEIMRLMYQYNHKLTLAEISLEVKLSIPSVRHHLLCLKMKALPGTNEAHLIMARPHAASLMNGRSHRTEFSPIRIDYDA